MTRRGWRAGDPMDGPECDAPDEPERDTYDCPRCEGTGLGHPSGSTGCPYCHGRGWHRVDRGDEPQGWEP